MMIRIIGKLVILILILVVSNPCLAFLNKNDIGSTTAQFLKLGMGGQANAMGEAVTALVNDSTSVCWNPAGLNSIQDNHLSLMHSVYFESIFYDYVTYAQRVLDIGTFGIGVQYLNYGSIKEIDETGTELGDFTPYDLAVIISYARKVFDFPIGLNVKYINSKIKNTGSAVAFDIGAQYSLIGDNLLLGFVVQNIGTKMKFVEEGSNLPLNIKVGVAYKTIDNLITEADVNLPLDNTVIVGVGSQYIYQVIDDWSVSPRIGYNTRTSDVSGFKGLSTGFGVIWTTYGLDYAFVPFGDLGMTYRISLSMKF